MPHVKYSPIYDELEIIYKESPVVSTCKTSNGLFVEFDGEDLAYIIAPNFSQAIHMRPSDDTIFTYVEEKISDSILTLIIQMNEQNINIKVDLS